MSVSSIRFKIQCMICHIRFFLPRKMWKQRNGAFRANHDEHRTCIRIKLTFLYDFYDLEIVHYYDITYILVMDTTISKFTLQGQNFLPLLDFTISPNSIFSLGLQEFKLGSCKYLNHLLNCPVDSKKTSSPQGCRANKSRVHKC